MANPHPNGDPDFASQVRMVDNFIDRVSGKASLDTTTKTLAEIISATLGDEDCYAQIVHDGTVQYNPDGDATAASAFIQSPFIVGNRYNLENGHFYAAVATDVSIIISKVGTTT